MANLNSIEDVVGSKFNDRIIGSDANNILEGGGGADYIDGGHGINTASYAHSAAAVQINLNNVVQHGGDAEGDQLYHIGNVIGSSFNDVLAGNSANNTLDGGAGFDRAVYANATEGVSVALAAGTVFGGASTGTDTLRSVEAIQGTNFVDKYDATGFGASSTNAGSVGTLNQFEGMGGDDTITGNGNTRIVFFNATGGVTVNLKWGFASGDASVGTDHFSGVNSVVGSSFADTIFASWHDDILAGGGGSDTFEFRFGVSGHHTITDFTAGDGPNHDVLGLGYWAGFTDFAAVQAAAQQVGSDVVITTDAAATITLTGVDLHALTAADFHFV